MHHLFHFHSNTIPYARFVPGTFLEKSAGRTRNIPNVTDQECSRNKPRDRCGLFRSIYETSGLFGRLQTILGIFLVHSEHSWIVPGTIRRTVHSEPSCAHWACRPKVHCTVNSPCDTLRMKEGLTNRTRIRVRIRIYIEFITTQRQ